MSDVIEQGARAAEFLLSEASGQRSREEITLAITTVEVPAGTVLVEDDDGYVPYVAPEPAVAITANVAISYNNKPVSEDVQQAAVIMRDAEVIGSLLLGLTAETATALASQGVIVR